MGLGDIRKFDLPSLKWGQLQLGTKLGEVEPVFPRADKSAIERMQNMEDQGRGDSGRGGKCGSRHRAAPTAAVATQAATSEAAGDWLTARSRIDDFAKVELRVGKVKVAEKVKGADKLLRLEVDIGTEVRQMVAGIAEAYAPETLVGTQSCDRRQSRPAKIARAGVERNDRRGLSGRRKAGAGRLSGGCAGGSEAEVGRL